MRQFFVSEADPAFAEVIADNPNCVLVRYPEGTFVLTDEDKDEYLNDGKVPQPE